MPLIRSLINVSLLVQLFEDMLHRSHMVVIRCPDKFIVAGIHQIPDFPHLTGNPVHMFLWRDSLFLRRLLNFLPVFVRSCQKKYVIAHQSFESCNRIGQNNLVGIANMGLL